MLMGEPQNDEAIARSQYSVETAEALGLEMEQIGETLVCNWDQAQAQDAINALWAAEGDNIEVIFANNDMMALGAVAAINGYGYNTGNEGDPSVVVIGVDAIDAALVLSLIHICGGHGHGGILMLGDDVAAHVDQRLRGLAFDGGIIPGVGEEHVHGHVRVDAARAQEVGVHGVDALGDLHGGHIAQVIVLGAQARGDAGQIARFPDAARCV